MQRTAARDALAEKALLAAGWSVVIIWECITRKSELLAEAVAGVAVLPRLIRPRPSPQLLRHVRDAGVDVAE